MEYVIREKKPGEKLWRIAFADCDLGTTGNLSSMCFESEKVAEEYGKFYYAYENTGNTVFQGVVLENGKKLDTVGRKVFEDANHPGDIYLVSDEIANLFLNYMRDEGAAMYERKSAWVDNLCDVGTVALDPEAEENAYCPFKIDWEDA